MGISDPRDSTHPKAASIASPESTKTGRQRLQRSERSTFCKPRAGGVLGAWTLTLGEECGSLDGLVERLEDFMDGYEKMS